MGIDVKLQEFNVSIVDMIDTAQAAKGKKFASIATSTFELMQAADALGRIAKHAATSDMAHAMNVIRRGVVSASSRVIDLLEDDKDVVELVSLASRMMERRADMERALRESEGRDEGDS